MWGKNCFWSGTDESGGGRAKMRGPGLGIGDWHVTRRNRLGNCNYRILLRHSSEFCTERVQLGIAKNGFFVPLNTPNSHWASELIVSARIHVSGVRGAAGGLKGVGANGVSLMLISKTCTRQLVRNQQKYRSSDQGVVDNGKLFVWNLRNRNCEGFLSILCSFFIGK